MQNFKSSTATVIEERFFKKKKEEEDEDEDEESVKIMFTCISYVHGYNAGPPMAIPICRLMRRRIKVADPHIFLIYAAYMHIRE